MKLLFQNVTAVTMNPAQPVIKNAFVAVEGSKTVSYTHLDVYKRQPLHRNRVPGITSLES